MSIKIESTSEHPVTAFSLSSIGPFLVAVTLLEAGGVALLLLALLAGWFVFAPGPRRARIFRRAQKLLHRGEWQQSLTLVKSLQTSGLSPAWQGRLRNLEGECHHAAAEGLLRDKNYEESLGHFQHAAGLLNLDAAELRSRVVESMLAEVRRLFAECRSAADNQAVQELLARTLRLDAPCPEALFWQALCRVRAGDLEDAQRALAQAHEQTGKSYLDPPLYLGTLRVRTGHIQEGLRLLGEANRIDANCPLVSLELGVGIVMAQGDGALAVRALQRALGPRGLAPWVKTPEKFWVETLPEGQSFVRRLALKHSFHCPVFGNDIAALIRQAQLALAQAEYRQGKFQEAANHYAKLLQDAPPSAPLLRGLGLSLARLEQYDQAYKHLRAALDMEEPKDPLTAGYLALCGALGKPVRSEDKLRNVEWSIALLRRFDVERNREWAHIYSTVCAEARSLSLSVALEDQLRLCRALASVDAVEPEAAAAYAQLAATDPDAIRPEYAWLYCRAAQLHDFRSDQDLELFGRTFREEERARAFFAQRQWDLDEAAYVYLKRAALQQPGQFPEAFGPDYPAHGEEMLLARSTKLEAEENTDAALEAADILHRLAPQSIRAYDRLAQLHYRRGDLDRAAELLAAWQAMAPTDPIPIVRRALVEHQRGRSAARSAAIHQALDLATGSAHAQIAWLGARLALAGITNPVTANGQSENAGGDTWDEALQLLEICLQKQPDHAEALWVLAATRAVRGNHAALAQQAVLMDRPEVASAQFHYLAAVCHLAAGNHAKVEEAVGRALASADSDLAVECHYLLGWAYFHRSDKLAAAREFERVANTPGSPSADHARAALGQLCFERGEYETAIRWWQVLDPAMRQVWQLDEPLRRTALLAGLRAHQSGRHSSAAELFDEASRLSLDPDQSDALRRVCLIKAAEQLLYGSEMPLDTTPVSGP